MPTLEERVAYLEGQVSEQSHAMLEVRDSVRDLERRMDVRFEAIDRRFENIERRIETLDAGLSRRMDALDDKVSRLFVWVVGVQVTTLVAIVGALLARA